MDDSDQDFADICSKFVKRVRKKAVDPVLSRKAEPQSFSQTRNVTADPSKKTRKKKVVVPEYKPIQAKPGPGGDWAPTRRPEQSLDNGYALCDAGDGGPPGLTDSGEALHVVEGGQRARDKVLLRMQQFKRASPHMLVHDDRSDAVPKQPKDKDEPPQETGSSDAALALRLQQSQDPQAAQDPERQASLDLCLHQDPDQQRVDSLEDQGLFFCQLCQRNMSHMTPEGRTQHLNRCLDETEGESAALGAPPPPPRVADCPICGKRFKAPKSRAAHLKRCSADMGVAPAVLLQCLQRQAAAVQSDGGDGGSSGSPPPRGASRGSKRKEPADPSLPTTKRPRKKAQPLDEETQVALALCSSLLEREKELEREAAAALAAVAPRLQWRAEAGQGRRKGGKRRKGGPPRPPPLLLVQDALAAQTRVQERVAALLLRQRPPSPPTPPRCPSRLPSAPARPLWSASALRDDADPRGPAQYYTPELRDLLLTRDPPGTTVASIAKVPPEPTIQSPVKADPQMTPLPPLPSPTPPCPSPSWAGTSRLSVGSQALRDVMELADEGRSLSQWLRDEACGTAVVADFPLSGFIPDECDAKMGLSGFLPGGDAAAAAASSQPIRDSGRPGGQPESGWRESVALSRLSCDLSSMVNNPQLSDVQVQVDSGEVFSVHSFMLYARCPLLAQMVHDAGFGVQEEGLPSTQRVLLGDCPGEAVLALLQYLYTGRCPAPAGPLLPALLGLATRFDLEELQSLAQLYLEEADSAPQEDPVEAGQPWDNHHPSPGVEPARGDQDFTKLLRSMWSEEEGEEGEEEGGGEATAGTSVDRRDDDGDDVNGGGQRDGRLASGDGDGHEERVNDEEMEEIYEFAATQRKLAEERESTGSVEEEEDEDEEPTSAEDNLFTKEGSPEHDETPVCVEADARERSPGCQVPSSLSYSRLFSGSWDVCEEEFPASPPLSSPRPSTSTLGPPQATPTPPRLRSPEGAFPRGDGAATARSDATCLQSSPSEIIDLSDSPGPPSTPGLPLPGLSPGRHRRGAPDADAPGGGRPGNPDPAADPGTSPKREGAAPRGAGRPASPDPPPPRRRAEPELIVLSDSSSGEDEGEGPAPAASPGPTPPHYPVWSQRHRRYTKIKAPSLHPGPCTSPPSGGDVQGPGWSDGAEEGGGDGGQGSARGVGVAAQSPDQLGFSPEVSWLIPATPPPPAGHPSSSICTQTRSSMFRTRLFPRASASASTSSPPSSPRSKGRAHSGSSASDGPPAKSKGPESSLDAQPLPGTFTPPAPGARPPGFPHPPLSSSSTKSTPAHGHPGPYSSTPLHARPPKPPVPLGTSLVRGDPAREALGRGHLSRSDPSRSASPSSLCRDPSGPDGDADVGRSGRTLGSDHRHGNTVDPEKIGDADESGRGEQRGSGVEAAVERGAESEAGHERGSELGFCQSFMDEPPMAFNDSWGLDGGGGGGGEGHGGQAVCFSLRLEDSEGVSSHQHSPVSPHSLQQHPPLTPRRYPDRGQNPSASRSPGTPPSTTAARPSVDPDTPHRVPEVNGSLLDPQLWDSWQEEPEEQDEALPVSQKGNAAARFQTPVSAGSRKRTALVPITPMPSYSDMDTPDLKNKLDR
ncbi:unnamed protein product [Gadus morhua 'NCC']